MHFTKSCIYGLRASILLSKRGGQNSYITIRELSEELNISFHFLTKILQELSKSEILESYKGPNGGVRLAKAPGKISFLEIVTSIDKNYTINNCPLGLCDCGDLAPCPLHQDWMKLKSKLENMLSEISLEDLTARSNIESDVKTNPNPFYQIT